MASNLKQQFDEQGFVAIRQFLDAEALNQLESESHRFMRDVVPKLPTDSVYYEDRNDPSTLKQVLHIHLHDQYYKAFAQSTLVTSLADELLGGPASLQEMQYFRKAPHTGKATPAHQDGFYFMISPHNALTMWLPLGYADSSNGGIRYVPKSHKKGVRPHGFTDTLGFSQGITDWSHTDSETCLQMEAKPGDFLIHHCLTVHCANPNNSDQTRDSIGLVFYGSNVTVDEKARAEYQLTLNSALKENGRI